MKIRWPVFLTAIAAMFTTGGAWYQLGFADEYPQMTMWLALGGVVLGLLINSIEDQPAK